MQTSVDNTVNVEDCVKDKNNFVIKPNISFLFKTKIYFILGEIFFKILIKHLIALAFFLPRQILKNIDIPLQKPRHLPITKANFKCCIKIVACTLYTCLSCLIHALFCYAAKHKVLVIPVFQSKLDHICCNMNHKRHTLCIVWIMSVEVSIITVLLRVK